MTLDELRLALREFARERDWEQFHSLKNLACALSVESGELLEHFQWKDPSDEASIADKTRAAISSEVADVLIYLIRFADVFGLDPLEAAERKLSENAKKYPADLARGTSKKYTEL